MDGIGVRTRRPHLLVVYVRYWSRHQRDLWPLSNVFQFTKSTSAATNRSLFDVHRTTATPKRTLSHLPRQSPLSFTTNCVSAARLTRRRRAQSDLVSISRFFENGTQQLANILEQYIIRSLRWSGLTRMPYETRNCRKPIATNGRPLTRPKAMAADAFVARTLAGRRHEWVYGSLRFQIMFME